MRQNNINIQYVLPKCTKNEKRVMNLHSQLIDSGPIRIVSTVYALKEKLKSAQVKPILD